MCFKMYYISYKLYIILFIYYLLLLSPCLLALDELLFTSRLPITLLHSISLIYLYLFIYLIYLPPLLFTLLYRTPLYNLSLKLWQLLGFCLLAVLAYCRSSPSCIALLFSIIVFSSVSPFPVSFSIFSVSFAPPFISHSSVTCLRSSFLLHSLHLFSPSSFQYSLALVWFPHLNLVNIFLSFHFILPSMYFGNFFGDFSVMYVIFGYSLSNNSIIVWKQIPRTPLKWS